MTLMDPVFAACQALGIGIAVGVLAGAAGMDGRARTTMTLLAAALGLVLGAVSSSAEERERRRRRSSPACSGRRRLRP